jgi:hypothetical protein
MFQTKGLTFGAAAFEAVRRERRTAANVHGGEAQKDAERDVATGWRNTAIHQLQGSRKWPGNTNQYF